MSAPFLFLAAHSREGRAATKYAGPDVQSFQESGCLLALRREVFVFSASLCLCGLFVTTMGRAQVRAPLGKISFPNSGAPAAQTDFIRGVLWLHSFGYEEAIDAFRAAQKIDPGFALAFWGEAMAFN